MNNATTNKLVGSYINFLTVNIGCKGENVKAKNTRSFKISELKNLLEKP